MTTMLSVLLLLQSDDTYTLRVHLKADQKGNDIHWIKRALADYDGIRNIQYDTNYDVLVLTMQADTLLTPTQLKEALPDRYSITKIEAHHVVGTVKQDRANLTFKTPAGSAALEKWDAQPQWHEYILKHAKEAEGFRIKALVEESKGRGPFARASIRLVVMHAETCKVKVSAAKTPDVTLKFLVDEVDDKEGKTVGENLKSIKGVTYSEFDGEGNIFTVSVKADTSFKLKDFDKAISKKGKVSKVGIEGVTGTLKAEGEGAILKAKGTGAEYVLEFNKPSGKIQKAITEKIVEKSGTDVRVSGELLERDGKLVIQVANIRPLNPNED